MSSNGKSNCAPALHIAKERGASSYWFARESKSIIFLIITLALVGAYLAFTIPISVFPTTNFPRIIIGVMGIQDVQSITSRGSAEIDLFFSWNVDMFQTLQRVNAAIARVQPTLPPTA